MAKQPTAELRAGLAAIVDLPGVVTLANPAWHPTAKRWAIHCRIAVGALPDGLVPAITDWYALVDDRYPHGCIAICPAKEGGVTQTFPHQNYNGTGCAQYPWRTGKLCTWTNAAPLHRHGYDVEPDQPERNLPWHLTRAQKWLELASRGKLALPGDPFELPDVPQPNTKKVVFCEGANTLRRWQENSRRYGTAEVKTLESVPSISVAIRFDTGRRQQPIEQEWHKSIGGGDTLPALWIKVDRVLTLLPWQLPATWGELRQACQIQGLNLDELLRPVLSKWTVESVPLLIGFPIPNSIDGPNVRMHWLALQLPKESDRTPPGFRNNKRGRWLAYKRRQLGDMAVLNWLATENWHRDEISVRGRLSSDTAQKRVLVIGAGAVGSVLAELLARAGVHRITVIDRDLTEAGNLVRHTLLTSDIGRPKASTLAVRLNAATLHGNIDGIDDTFPPDDEELIVRLMSYDVVIDTTGDDDVADALRRFQWGGIKTFVSVSLGLYARRLFCFTAHGPDFPEAAFRDSLQPWLLQESSEYDIAKLPRDGPGCWHIRHPARIDDVWMLTAAAVRLVEQSIDNPPDVSTLIVLERHTDNAGNFAGIRDASHDEMPR